MVTDKYRGGGGFAGATGAAVAPTGHPMRFPEGAAPAGTTDREYARTQYACDLQVAVFRTWSAAEMTQLREVLDRVYNRLYLLVRRMDREDEDPETGARGWAVYLEWISPWGVPAQGRRSPY